jgi:hypothetical protein
MSASSLSYRVLSGSCCKTAAPAPLAHTKLVALYHLTPNISQDTVSRDLSLARLAAVDAFCFVVQANVLCDIAHLLAPFLNAHPTELSFCICISDAANNVNASQWSSLAALFSNHRYLRQGGKPVVVVDSASCEISTNGLALEDVHLVRASTTQQSSPLPSSPNPLLLREPSANGSQISDYAKRITASLQGPQYTGIVYRCASPLGATGNSATLSYRLFETWLYYLRMLACESNPAGLVFMDGWNTPHSAVRPSDTSTLDSLGWIEATARSSWATPPSAADHSRTVRERIESDLTRIISGSAEAQSIAAASYRGRSKTTHSLLNWLRSFECIHRPFRALRDFCLALTRGAP